MGQNIPETRRDARWQAAGIRRPGYFRRRAPAGRLKWQGCLSALVRSPRTSRHNSPRLFSIIRAILETPAA